MLLARLIDERTKRNRRALAVSLKHDPGIVALALGPPRTRNFIEDFFSGSSLPGTAHGVLTSPSTLIKEVFWVTSATTTCGSIARFFSALTIDSCTSAGVRFTARIAPAYGTLMLPELSTDWLGSCTKLPGRTPASDGMNKPPAAASKIVTLTTSPMPNLICSAGRRSVKICESPGAFVDSTSITCGVSFTRA